MAEQATRDPVGLSIARMCALVQVPRSSYYAWCQRQQRGLTPRARRHQDLTAAIIDQFQRCQGRVGRRPMRILLTQAGTRCAPGTVHTIMAEQGLQAGRRRAYRRSTRSDPAARVSHIRNHCLDAAGQRDFTSAHPGMKTVGDITYLPTREGWQYLAVVLDLATRAVLGWSLRPTLQTDLIVAALEMARQHGHLRQGAIFHSDRGSQYTSAEFQRACTRLRVTQSMGTVGTCWDNAPAESFFATLKADLAAEVGVFLSRDAATGWVATYIEGWYNRRRPHTWTAGTPPMLELQRVWGLTSETVHTS